ncbi:MAG: thioredoxin [Chloroflexota bacterium]|nr:thioredoxin [Chloroflexota bacterium]
MALNVPVHTDEHSIDRVVSVGVPVMLVFWRRACPPCEQLNAVLERLADAYAGRALIAKIDARHNPGLVRRYGVTHLPGLVFIKDRTPVAQASGAASEAALRAWLEHLVHGKPRPPLPAGPSVPLEGPAPGAPSAAPPHPATPTPEPGGPPRILSDATFDRVVGTSNQPVLVDFWAPWCGPCRIVAPTVERLAQEFAGRAVVAKLNVDEHPRTAQRFGISSIPALLIFKRGQVVERLVGAQPAPVLRQALAKHAEAKGGYP